MVENTVEQNKNNPLWKNTLLQITAGAIVMLGLSAYMQFSGAKDFFGVPIQPPAIDQRLEDPLSLAQPQNKTAQSQFVHFSTPDGYLSLDYPADYTSSQETIDKLAGQGAETDDALLIAYKTTLTDIKPITLTVTRYNATTTDDVIGIIESTFKQQQCQFDIKKSPDQNEDDQYELFDSSYRCGNQGDLSYWSARTAIAQNETIFYSVTIATISKNWENSKLEVNSILNSISVKNITPNKDPEKPAEEKSTKNNETEN